MLFQLLQAVPDTLAKAAEAPAVPAEQTLSLLDLATKGGWLMIVLLILSIIAIYIFGSKWWMIHKASKVDRNFIKNIRSLIHDGKTKSAIELCRKYDTPTAIITEYRESNFYTESHIKVDARYSSLNNLNTITIKYRIKKSTENTWGAWTTISDNVEADFNADNQYAWDIQVELDDAVGGYQLYTINKALDVGIPIVFYDVLMRSVGVNYLPTKNETLMLKGIDLSNTYSTTEQVVGYWIDGKPIYRKVITKSNTNDITNVADNVDNVVKMECLIRQTTANAWRNIPWLFVQNNGYGGASWAGGFYYDVPNNLIHFQIGSDLGTIDRVIMILQYTKTTD